MSHTETERNSANVTISDQDAAERLGVSAVTVQQKCRTKEWPHRRIGRAYRFTEDDIAAILALTAVGPATKAKAAQSWGRRGRSAS